MRSKVTGAASIAAGLNDFGAACAALYAEASKIAVDEKDGGQSAMIELDRLISEISAKYPTINGLRAELSKFAEPILQRIKELASS